MKKVNILIVEDSVIFAQGLEMLLNNYKKANSVYTVHTYYDTFESLKKYKIQIIILDLNFETNEYDGFVIAKKVKTLYPAIKIIILTQHTRIDHYDRLFNECKVDAYLDKQLGIQDTYRAIDAVMENRRFVDESITKMLEIKSWMQISKREKEILNLLFQGLTQKEIAAQLFISDRTVETHVRNMVKKFEVKNSIELIGKYTLYISANRENFEDTKPPFMTG